MDDTEDTGAHAAPAPLADSFQSIPVDAWLLHKHGGHVDQGAGFLHWAKKNGHARHSSAEWETLFTQFSNRPIG